MSQHTKNMNNKKKTQNFYLPVAGDDDTPANLTANKNCTAQTSKQQRFNERDKAQSANVTSYTIAYSSKKFC
jgi:hypothetical protein